MTTQTNATPRGDGFISRYIVYILSVLLLIGSGIVFWYSYQKNQSIHQEIAVYEASQFAGSVSRFRTFYSEHFVPRAKESGLEITHDYLHRKNALPLPATMMLDFAKYLSDGKASEYEVRFYSDKPFPWRKDGGARDDFERWALVELRKNPEKAVWRFEGEQGQQRLRYARADRLTESCVGCHNTYQNTPKNDWKVGDVRGVLEVNRPLSGFENATKQAMMESFLMLLGLGMAMLLVLMLALRGLRGSLKATQSSETAARLANHKLVLGIEERERLAENLKASEIKTRTIVDSVLDAIVVINAKGVVIETNQSVLPILGYTPEELLGQNIKILMEGDHHIQHDHYIQRYLQTGEQHIIGNPRQLMAKRKDGSLLPIDLSVNEARFGDSLVFTGIIRDISQRLQQQQDLAQARDAALESARLKSEFLANMSHEIRTPMNGVIGMTELLLDSKLTKEQHDQVHTVQQSAESLLRIINDILDFSKIEAGKLSVTATTFELLPVIEGVIDLLAENAHGKGLELALLMERDVPAAIVSDPLRLRQILLNLLSNAIKFTARGHVVLKISVSGDALASGTLAVLRFDVMDTGCGIPTEAQVKLFTAFSQVDGSVTRQHGGTGLGLAISRQLAQLMGGDIGLESQVGVGSTFWASISVEISQLSQIPVLQSVPAVLVWGAKPLLNPYYDEQLQQWGLEPVRVDSFNSLLLTLESNPQFDLIVLDADLAYHKPEHPFGMIAVMQAVREHTQAVVMIYGTGRQVAALEKARLGQRVKLVTKPIKHSGMLRYLTQWQANNGMANPEIADKTSSTELSLAATPEMDTPEAVPVRILLTEDHLVNQKVALAMLKKLGYTHIDFAVNGKEALQAVQQQCYSLVLMDCQMPVMDGYEATRQIRQLDDACYQELPIVALTAHTMNGDDQKCYEAGMNDYLSKPVRLEELQQKLEKWLRVQHKLAA